MKRFYLGRELVRTAMVNKTTHAKIRLKLRTADGKSTEWITVPFVEYQSNLELRAASQATA